jgi:hypothetical protein
MAYAARYTTVAETGAPGKAQWCNLYVVSPATHFWEIGTHTNHVAAAALV